MIIFCLLLSATAIARPVRKLAFFIVYDPANPVQRRVHERMVRQMQAFRLQHGVSPRRLPILTWTVDDPVGKVWCEHLGIPITDLPAAGVGIARRDAIIRVASAAVRLPPDEAILQAALQRFTRFDTLLTWPPHGR